MSMLRIDRDKLRGKLVVALIDPQKVDLIANLGVSIAQFLGREVPSHVLAQDLLNLLDLVAEAPQSGTSDGDQNAGVGTSEGGGTPPVQDAHRGPDDS